MYWKDPKLQIETCFKEYFILDNNCYKKLVYVYTFMIIKQLKCLY